MRQLNELYRIGGKLSKVKDRAQPAFKQAAQQYGRIKRVLVGAMVKIAQDRFVKCPSGDFMSRTNRLSGGPS